MSDLDIPEIINMMRNGLSLTKISKVFGISRKNKKLLELKTKIYQV